MQSDTQMTRSLSRNRKTEKKKNKKNKETSQKTYSTTGDSGKTMLQPTGMKNDVWLLKNT